VSRGQPRPRVHADDWLSLVQSPAPGDHLVQLYDDDSFLARAVAAFVTSGLGWSGAR
jgi:hypothetical protein